MTRPPPPPKDVADPRVTEADLERRIAEAIPLRRVTTGLRTIDPREIGESSSTRLAPQWPVLDDAALIGPIGDLVRTIGPNTEADPAAILFTALAYFGIASARNCHWQAEGAQHFGGLYVVVVGASAKARKGTSENHVRRIFRVADPNIDAYSTGGLSSGEGLIEAIRDEARSTDKRGDEQITQGVDDKRLLVVESEFARSLAAMGREGSTLSAVLREAWDGRVLRVLNRRANGLRASDPHVGIVAHITLDELRRCLRETEQSNGFGNRILWVAARRQSLLPFGGAFLPSVEGLAEPIRSALAWSWGGGEREIAFDDLARRRWVEVYHELAVERRGLLGSITARGEAQTRRLALVYAMSERSDVVSLRHLEAGYAAWVYAAESAAMIFGAKTGDSVADRILEALREARDVGLSREQISGLFARNKDSSRISEALALLESLGLAKVVQAPSSGQRGRPPEVWYAANGTQDPDFCGAET